MTLKTSMRQEREVDEAGGAPHRDTGTRDTQNTCAHCGKPSGSISKGTGRPLIRNRKGGSLSTWEHVNCRPANITGFVAVAGLAGMAGLGAKILTEQVRS